LHHGKYLLKKIMVPYLPSAIIKRKKEGFNVPKIHWLKNELKEFTQDCLSQSKIKDMGLFEPSVVQKLISDHMLGSADNSHQLWCLLSLSLWWDKFMSS
jgi:asparagine synthase (glutamine-hydrolysing)